MRLRRRSRYGYRSRLRAPVLLAAGLASILLGAAVGVLGLAALWYEPERVVSRTVWLKESPDVVWQVLVGLDDHPSWRRGVSRIERLPDDSGQPAWLEFDGASSREVRIAEALPPVRLVTEHREANGVEASLAWDLTRSAAGSQLTVTRRVVLSHPVERAVGGLFGLPGRELDRAVADLSLRLSAAARLRTTALNR